MPSRRNFYVFDLLAGGIEYRDPASRDVDVAAIVDGHAVGAHGGEEAFASQPSVGGYIVGVGLFRAYVGYVEGFSC